MEGARDLLTDRGLMAVEMLDPSGLDAVILGLYGLDGTLRIKINWRHTRPSGHLLMTADGGSYDEQRRVHHWTVSAAWILHCRAKHHRDRTHPFVIGAMGALLFR